MTIHAYLLLDGQSGAILSVNRSVEGGWLSAQRYGPTNLLLPDGSALTVEALERALADFAEITLSAFHSRDLLTFNVQRHALGI